MSKKIYIYLGLIIILIIGISLSLKFFIPNYLNQEELPQKNILKVACQDISLKHLPFLIALELDFFKEENLEIELISCFKKDQALELISKGQADIALVKSENFFKFENLQEKTTQSLIAFAYLNKAFDTYLLGREDNSSFKWSDLQNKTIIIGENQAFETIFCKNILTKNQISQSQLTFIQNIPLELVLGAFESGTGDYLLLSQELAMEAETEKIATNLTSLYQDIATLPEIIAITSSKTTAIQNFTNALYKALLWLENQNQGEIKKLYNNSIYLQEIDNLDILSIYLKNNIYPKSLAIPSDSVHFMLSTLEESKAFPRKISWKINLDNSFANKAFDSITYTLEEDIN